jgi:hypothetical protein
MPVIIEDRKKTNPKRTQIKPNRTQIIPWASPRGVDSGTQLRESERDE